MIFLFEINKKARLIITHQNNNMFPRRKLYTKKVSFDDDLHLNMLNNLGFLIIVCNQSSKFSKSIEKRDLQLKQILK